MRLGFLSVCGVPLLAALLSGVAGLVEEGGGGGGSCLTRIRPGGPCLGDNGDECPYRVTLPPLTVHLPKQFRMMEKTAQELRTLRATVNQLKRSCLACRLPAHRDLQSDSARRPAPDLGQKGKGGKGMEEEEEEQGSEADGDEARQDMGLREMEAKMKRMSNSLRKARGQIGSLQARLDEMDKVDKKGQDQCSSQCPVEGQVQFMLAPRDCSDYNALEQRRNGVYDVTPDPRNGTFQVYCDMESHGGGWTVVQQRLDGSVGFNRTWDDYKRGFGDLRSDFWLGNDRIHLLTKAKDMVLRIELEDFDGVREYARYEQFYVANELLRYRLSVSGYSGTAGDALHFSKHYNHDQKFFSTPDKDNDAYPSGNCGAYYGSGWWFDACMSANLNGKYYRGRYKGVRNGIFWGTWHNVSSEHYPSNYRQAFKTVRMMIRPKNYAP